VEALKKGGKFIGIVLISPLLLAAWLYEHGFNLNIKLDGLTGGLISLEDFFLGGNQPAVKEIGRKLKIATDIAKRVVTNTIAEQEFLQKQINDKTRTAESVKQQILSSLDSQIANIKSTLANLSADIKQVTVDPEYDNLIDEIDLEGSKGNSRQSANANLMAELNLLLDSIQKAYEGMALGDEATVAQKNVEKFKQIRKNFDDMLSLPQKMRDQLKDAPASAVGAKLKELGRDARSRTAKLGYNVGQFFSRGATRVASMFGRGQKFSNANRTLKNAVAPRNNVQYTNNPIGAGVKKPSFFNRLKGFGSRAAGFFSRKKSPNVAAANRGLNAYKSPALGARYPAAAAAAYTRKNRRYH
jgi:predicted  nucleic acid-binding Zn-ribbon protein